ncbi:MAG: ABC transporter substrate-binding protein [Oceanospirillaceae bacterium]
MLNFKKTLLIAMTWIAATAVTTVSAETTMEKIVKTGKMSIAVQTQGPPTSFINKNGDRTGLAVELAQQFADDMGVELEIKDYDWKGLIPALKSGKVDFIAADMTPTAKRHMQVLFTDPAFFAENVMFAKKDKGYKSWAELNDKKFSLGATQASSYASLARELLPNAKLKEYAGGTPQTVQAILGGRIDAGISDRASLSTYIKQYPELTIVEFMRKEPLGFAVRPDSMHLLLALNNYLQVIEHDGSKQKLLDYWWNTTNWEAKHK